MMLSWKPTQKGRFLLLYDQVCQNDGADCLYNNGSAKGKADIVSSRD